MKTIEQKIKQLPDDLQQEVLVFIEFLQFKSGLKKFPKNIDQIMKFAGCWEDMPDETFTEFSNEIDKRRKQAFSGRRKNETNNS